MEFMYIIGTILFTVYGQMILKWQVTRAGPIPVPAAEKLWFLTGLVMNPWVLSCVLAGFLAFLMWIVALSKFELSYAYPFVSLSFVLVLILGGVFFHEGITVSKVIGVGFIIMGVIIGSRG